MRQRKSWRQGWALVISGLLATAPACSDGVVDPDPTPPVDPAPALEFVGSQTCQSCHGAIYARHQASGHPYKIMQVVNGQPPKFPFSVTPDPPGFSWNDVLFTVGGYGYKTRFVGKDGYFITQGGNNQWNLNTNTWSNYQKDQRSAFDCGRCHTTGYEREGHQFGIEGLIGTWKEDGVGCEACHGPGSQHRLAPVLFPMKVDASTEACASCHNRNGADNPEITVQNGFLMHRDALHSLRNTPGHSSFTCVTCHDPHQGALYARERGIQPVTKTCESCHPAARQSLQAGALPAAKANQACTTCHMAPMTVSAIPTRRPWLGDMKAHLVVINTDPAAPQFYGEGNNRSHPYITLGFACLGCHEGQTVDWAGEYADAIHKW
jgi:hypothetical protein